MEIETFIRDMPKVELHLHIEGTLTPQLRWKLAKKNNVHIPYETLEEFVASYDTMYQHRKELTGDLGLPVFLEAYYGGMTVLQTESDFYELAMDYFKKAASMKVRYAEPFFDIQAHTRRGIRVSDVMNGLKKAKEDALALDVKSNWTLCFLRDMSVESAEEAYEACIPYIGTVFKAIGLDSNEFNRPPNLFDNVFTKARAAGLKVTSHCDVNQKNTHEHIRQVASQMAETGLDRIDHGLNAAEEPELIAMIKEKNLGMTLCPHAYHRRNPTEWVFPLIRKLFDAGIKITVSSDDPTYMRNYWVADNLQLVRQHCQFDDSEMVQLQKNAIEICWAHEEIKSDLMKSLNAFASAQTASR